MRILYGTGLVLCLLASTVIATAGERQSVDLRHNPFARPATLTTPVETTVMEQEVIDRPVEERELNATLVSEDMPLVVIDGELLKIGESIDGYRLVDVQQGKAVFRKAGKEHAVLLVGNRVEVE